MACLHANAEDRKCQMVVVSDDAALPRAKGITGARGVAGTVLVHKCAGAAAAKGMDLDAIVNIAKVAAANMGSLGVALDAVTIPGASTTNDRLDAKTIEIGLGIHGEAGIRQSHLLSCDEIAKELVLTILDFGLIDNTSGEDKIVSTFKSGDELAVMVNNLGGTSQFEMSILTQSIVSLLESSSMGCNVSRVYTGSFMTSFNMNGASLTILSLAGDRSAELKELLDAPSNSLAWSAADVWNSNDGARPSATEMPEVERPTGASAASYENVKISIESFAEGSKSMLKAAAQTLIDNESKLTEYDLIVGDGDCGLTMKRGGEEILSRIENGKIDFSHLVPMFSSLADAVSMSMGGTSGILIELMFRKMSTFLNSCDNIDEKAMALAFEEGVKAISFYGGASVGARTMLDALFPAAEALIGSTIADAASAAKLGADSTARMDSASAGRSNYLSADALSGTPDPGAVAAALVLKAIGSV